MSKYLSKRAVAVGLLAIMALAVAAPVKAGSINKSVKIEAGQTSGGASSVNGSIAVGSDAVVSGDLDTVNGRIRVESNAAVEDVSTVNGSLRIDSGVKAHDLSTVNGAITIDSNATIDGEIEAVNGAISIDEGSAVADDVSNVNGKIDLHACTVRGSVATVSGDIELSGAAEVYGDIIVEKPGGWGWSDKGKRMPQIVIGPGSRVHGTIRLERKAELYISDTAEVGGVSGELSLDDAVRFSGEHP